MELRPGYKQTEVGVIPEEWDVKPLAALFNFSGGFTASRNQLSSEGYCYLHYGDIHKSTKTFIDVQAEYQDIPKLDISLKCVPSASLLDDGDVVFVDASEDDEGTSKHVVVINKEDTTYISGLHTIVAKSTTDDLEHAYRRYCFQTRDIKRQFYFYAVGTKVSGISKANIAKLLIPLPTLPEQRAIAAALSDVDALLAKLDQLIAKKRDIKQAVMQQLLTGKQRLPGFSGEWEVKPLNSISSMHGRIGWQGLKQEEFTANEDDPFLITGMNFRDGEIKWSEVYHIPDKRYEEAKPIQLRNDDILMTKDGTIGKILYVKEIPSPGKASLNSHLLVFRPLNEAYVPMFLFYQLNSKRFSDYIDLNKSGTTFFGITQEAVGNYPTLLPCVGEQTAIANILSDMDAEIAKLEARRDKTRALKQGMMQELLTGRIRLE
jgi:type I restriction enzyme S subunit